VRVVLETLFLAGVVGLGEHYYDGRGGRRTGLLKDHAPDVRDGVGGWALGLVRSFAKWQRGALEWQTYLRSNIPLHIPGSRTFQHYR